MKETAWRKQMAINNSYTVFGDDVSPKIQFYHEIVNPKKTQIKGELYGALHTQAYYEFSFFISGKRKIKVEDKVYDFKAGDVFLVAPNEKHGGEIIHDTLDRYRLHIWPHAFDGLPDTNGIMEIFDRAKNQTNQITLTEAQQKTVYHYLSNIDNSIKLGTPSTKNLSALADIIKLLVFLNDLVYKNEESLTPKNKLLLNILSFVESSYDTITVGEIETQFSISHATLWRLFQKELATSPSAYILDIKLKKAKIILSQDMDIQTVSDQCGFCDCSYFIKKFKKKYGATPYKSKI